MSVRTTALLMMIGLGGTFLLRTLNSVLPTLYAPPPLARLAAIWFFVASLFALSFFWSVQSAWQGGGRTQLEAASRLAAMGAALAVLLRLRGALNVFRDVPGSATSVVGEIVPFLELISVLTLLWFFYVVHVRLGARVHGTGGALLGAALFSLAALLVFLLQELPAVPKWLAQRSWPVVVSSIPLGFLAVGGLLRFLFFVRRNPQALTGVD